MPLRVALFELAILAARTLALGGLRRREGADWSPSKSAGVDPTPDLALLPLAGVETTPDVGLAFLKAATAPTEPGPSPPNELTGACEPT